MTRFATPNLDLGELKIHSRDFLAMRIEISPRLYLPRVPKCGSYLPNDYLHTNFNLGNMFL